MTFKVGDDGIALFAVLLAILFLSVVAVSLLNTAAIDNRVQAVEALTVREKASQQAMLLRAVAGMTSIDVDQKWNLANRTYEVRFDDEVFAVSVGPESGKVDLNTADDGILRDLLIKRGADPDTAARLVDALADWRDEDSLVRLNGAEDREYSSQGLSYKPRNAPLQRLDELFLVVGFDAYLVNCLRDDLTLYSRRRDVDARFARSNASFPVSEQESGTGLGEVPTGFLHGSPGQAYFVRIGSAEGISSMDSEVIVRISGDVRDPFVVLDWRSVYDSRSFEANTEFDPAECFVQP